MMAPKGMQMTISPNRRTGVSNLTDAELLILDIAANLGGTRRLFRREVFPYQYNCPTHGLDDATLNQTLDRFETQGWLTGENFEVPGSGTDRSIRVTPAGGQLWEAERLPDWTRHVMEVYGRTRPGTKRHRVSIF